MKKVSLYIVALLGLVLTACNDDFPTEFVQQTSAPESTFPMDAVSMTPTAQAIDLVTLLAADEEQPIEVGKIALSSPLPANTVLKAEVQLSRNNDFAQVATIDATVDDNVISISPSALGDAYYGTITKNPAATTLYLRTLLYTVTGGEAEAIIGTPGENYFATQSVAFTPEFRANISPAYYIVGGPNDWAASAAEKPIKFQHSDKDVYEDPVFTVIFDAAAEGDTWFAIGDDEACDAIGEGTWNKLLGIVGGNSQATEGQLDFRYNMGAENSFCVPAGPKKIKVTIDMLEYSFKVETVNVADNYYIVGGTLDWAASAASKEQKFSHSSLSVADDPVFTYVFEGTGGDIWFAIGDDEACDAIANNGDWSKLYGPPSGNGENGLTGSLARRSSLSDEGSFKIDGTAKFIRVQINMAELTYTITPLNFAEYIYEAGVNNGWGSTEQPLYCADGNGMYTGFFYAQDADWSDGMGAFKFRGAADNWDNGNWGAGSYSDEGGTLTDSDAGNLLATPGFYRADVDLASMSYTLTAIKSVYVVGSAVNNDWDTGVLMTYNMEKLCWECDTELGEGVIKFKGNGTWENQDGNWGGTLDNIINGSNDNIPVSITGMVHIEFYPTCDTRSYATVTKL